MYLMKKWKVKQKPEAGLKIKAMILLASGDQGVGKLFPDIQ